MAEPKFEKDLERLEKIVEALEEGGLSLDESLKRFEEGIKLARRCDKALCEAERKIQILVKNAAGDLVAEPFGEEEGKIEETPDESDQSAESDDSAEAEGPDQSKGGLLF